ncbi:Bug family tripartite tricarboxylate transporter substrate binding protein [Cupriavidus sp. 30B13]|uniref:Bug family tripartite tricarboxylate transporter substrate binding protein n=1 Tax=Cupriavidus sp. 30B13 TaxID=3384241 RepID=UPI003B91BDC8
MTTRRLFCGAMLLATAGALPLARAADAWPSRPLRIIVPFTGGSGADASARFYAEKMSPMLGQPIIVENRPGADGAIGIMAVKALPADGYTILQGSIGPMTVNPAINADLQYDPMRDFVPLTGYGRNMNVIIVSNESKLNSFAELLASGRASPAALNMGTFSPTLALTGAWLAKLAGAKFNNIPYKGQGQVMTEVIGNQLDFGMVDLGGASTLIRAGKVRALAVTGDKRHADFPSIPTVKESGIPEFSQYSWNAFYVRADTPAPIRAKLGEAIRTVMTSEATIRTLYAPKGSEGVPLTPAQMQELQQNEIARFRRVAAEVGMVAR